MILYYHFFIDLVSIKSIDIIIQNMEAQTKFKIDDILNSRSDNPLSYFYVSNKIISQPDIALKIFASFNQYTIEEQKNILTDLITILKTNTTNSYALVQAKDQENNNTISYVIDLIPQYQTNYVIFNLLLEVLELLFKGSSLREKIVRPAIQKNIVQFYDNKILGKSLFSTISILRLLYEAKVQAQKDPKNTLIFHGKRGLELTTYDQKGLKWQFSHGITFCCWIYLENIKYGAEAPLPKLFTLYSPNNGGLQCYIIDNKIFYRTIGSKYSEPNIGSNGVPLGQLQPKKWNFLAIEHQPAKTLSRSKLTFYLNKSKWTHTLDPQKISSSQKAKYIFFDSIYCKSSSFCLFQTPVGSTKIEQLRNNMNSIDTLKAQKLLIFQQKQGRIYERSGFGFCSDYVFYRTRQMNFKHVFPFFYFLRFVEQNNLPLLNQLLGIFILFLRSSPSNQHQASQNHYLKVIAQLLSNVNGIANIFDQSTIKILLHIKHTITQQSLLDQYFSEFLWPLSQLARGRRQEQILEIIKHSFTLNIGHFSVLIGMDEVLNSLLNLQQKSYTCCEKHYYIANRKFEYGIHQTVTGKNEGASNTLLSLIEVHFQNPKISYAEQAYKLCRLLTLKLSPCLILSLMGLIKKIVSQKINEKLSQDQAKKIIKLLAQKKAYLIFLHTIQNNIFVEIKAQAAKFIYLFLMKKITPIQQLEISKKIAQSLLINETIEMSSPAKTVFLSPKRISVSPKSLFTHVGPRAPLLSNRTSKDKTFDFKKLVQTSEEQPNPTVKNAIKKKLKIQVPSSPQQKNAQKFVYEEKEIMQEEKTIENQIIEEPIRNSKNKKPFLSINTQAINEMYTFGGQKGQQIMISQEQEIGQLQKIQRLAKICVAKMKGQVYVPENEKRFIPVMPLLSTRNKNLVQKSQKNIVQLKQINEQQQQRSQTKSINRAGEEVQPNSTKSAGNISVSDQQSLCLLYNSLMECCLGSNLYSSTTGKIQFVSALTIFFNWIPQTELEVKFLNDLQIILESTQNMQTLTQVPQFFDFLMELCFKAIVFEQMEEKRIYVDKLESLIKGAFSFIFQQDPNAMSKFGFIRDWIASKGQQYHPKCLFLTGRYVMLLVLQSIEQFLIMNNQNSKANKIMQRNFQNLGTVIQHFIHYQTSKNDLNFILADEFSRAKFTNLSQITPSLSPYFKSQWADCLICQKYMFLFRKFFCTDWYIKNSHKKFTIEQIKHAYQSNYQQLIKQSNYYLKNSFLIAVIEITQALLIQAWKNQLLDFRQKAAEAMWQISALIFLGQINKDKQFAQHKLDSIKIFLKSCTILWGLNAPGSTHIPEILKNISTAIAFIISQKNSNIQYNQLSQEIIIKFMPQWMFQTNTQSQSLKAAFAEILPQTDFSILKNSSQMFIKLLDKTQKMEEVVRDYIENLSEIMEQQKQRQHFTKQLLEINQRITKNEYRKLWKNLRMFGSPWTHPQFLWQEDSITSKMLYSYQKYRPSHFYKWKIAKHTSKYKARYFIEPRLVQPQIAEERYDQDYPESQQLYLDKAIYSSVKLSLGKSILNWLTGQDKLEIILEFKKVRIINTLTVRHGTIGILNDKLVFLSSYIKQSPSHLSISEYYLRKDKSLVKIWPLQFIKEINRRRFMNRHTAVQISFIHGKSIFLDFEHAQIDQFCKKIIKMKDKRCPNLVYYKSLEVKKIYENQGLLKKWSTYQMTNFQYLMELNHISGRSYSDVTQYPVFPWVLINFGEKISLSEPTAYRNLNLPLGALGSQQRTRTFAQRYQMMPVQQKGMTKFHYGTHYSSPGIIYHFLIRLNPFTEGAILLQSGKFDFADRLFFSMADSYKNATTQYSDVRQLVPQMYTIPEIYLNLNKNDFGLMQNKKRVHNVQLPAWSKDNPYIYVTKMRRALQDQHVSSTINGWFDLIFGFKQKGEEAIKALNCFYYLTYEDSINFDEIDNEKMAKALQTQILNFGQTPSQIFTKPHSGKGNIKNIQDYYSICDQQAHIKVYRPTQGKGIQSQHIQINPLRQMNDSIIHMKWVKQNKLVFMKRNGILSMYKWHYNNPGQGKMSFQCAIQKEKKIEKIEKAATDLSENYDQSLDIESFPMQFLNFGHVIALGGLNQGKLILIDSDNGHIIETYHNNQQTICCLAADSKDNFLISGDITGHVIVWRITSNYKLLFYEHFHDQQDQITNIFISYELKCFAIASKDGSVILYNIITGKKMRAYYHPKKLPINNVVISTSPLACVLLFCNKQSTLYCYSINGQLISRVLEKQMGHFLSPVLLKDSVGFEFVAYGNQHGQVIFRALPFLQETKRHIVAKEAAVNRVIISKNGRFLVSGCSDGQLSVLTDPAYIQK